MEIDRMDLATLLSSLGSDLRNTGLAVRELGSGGSPPDGHAAADMDRLAGSLDRIATILAIVRERLCASCGLAEVSERFELVKGDEQTARRVTRRHGKRNGLARE